jgi:8-oxo-dGTP pyrophosphatase MutT (NUDIX family)
MTATAPLRAADASAALIVLDDGRYVLQLRDDKPDIWYPGHWGCFGGAAEPGEAPAAALRRELHEELALDIAEPEWFTRFVFDLSVLGAGPCARDYYVVRLSEAELARCRLGEGAGISAFPAETALNELRLVPYDSFALYLHRYQRSIR